MNNCCISSQRHICILINIEQVVESVLDDIFIQYGTIMCFACSCNTSFHIPITRTTVVSVPHNIFITGSVNNIHPMVSVLLDSIYINMIQRLSLHETLILHFTFKLNQHLKYQFSKIHLYLDRWIHICQVDSCVTVQHINTI